MSGPIQVDGGVGGTAVGLDSLDRAAFQLVRAGLDLSEVLARTLLLAADVELLASIVASPVTGAEVEVALACAVGPGGLAGQLAAMSELATATSLATAAYREAERQVALSLDPVHDAVMFELGANAPALAVGAFTAHALGADLHGLGLRADRSVYDHPELADLGGGVAGLTAGLRINPLTAPLLAPGDLRASSRSDPVEPYDGSLRVLGGAAESWGLLSDAGRARVLPEPAPRTGAAAPTSVAELARGQLNLSDADDYPGHVRVVEVPRPGGGSAWIVEISGTQVWDPRAGSNPHDVTTDVRLMARESTVLAAGVERGAAPGPGRVRPRCQSRPGAAQRPQPRRHRRGGSGRLALVRCPSPGHPCGDHGVSGRPHAGAAGRAGAVLGAPPGSRAASRGPAQPRPAQLGDRDQRPSRRPRRCPTPGPARTRPRSMPRRRRRSTRRATRRSGTGVRGAGSSSSPGQARRRWSGTTASSGSCRSASGTITTREPVHRARHRAGRRAGPPGGPPRGALSGLALGAAGLCPAGG